MIVQVVLGSLLIAVLASIIPAWRAAAMHRWRLCDMNKSAMNHSDNFGPRHPEQKCPEQPCSDQQRSDQQKLRSDAQPSAIAECPIRLVSVATSINRRLAPMRRTTSFAAKKPPQEPLSLDARESLDIPLASFRDSETGQKTGAGASPAKPGIGQPLGPPSMPDSDRVSQLPENETDKSYMVQDSHKPAGPHVVIDTPFPEESPSVDTLPRGLQRPRSSRTNIDEVIPPSTVTETIPK